MARQNVAFLIHPFKNQLHDKGRLKQGVEAFGKALLELLDRHSSLRYNVVLPGYALEALDGLMLSELRDHRKRGALEWLVVGYTEPFLSLSPTWLSRANIRTALDLAAELLDERPGGYVPPFSNWEPFTIELLRELGLHYAVLSSSLFPAQRRNCCGYWATEHLGASLVTFPSHAFHSYNAPANLSNWLQNAFAEDRADTDSSRLVVLHYLLRFSPGKGVDPYRWLRSASRLLSRIRAKYPTVRFSEFLADNPPLGLQYLPPSLDVNREGAHVHGFRNWLFSHEQVGLLNRRMLEVCDQVSRLEGRRGGDRLVRELFTVQDINRSLPGSESGFPHLADRFWSYAKLVEIEKGLPDMSRLKGGQIRITDHLRNGNKSIIMLNRALKVYINHRNGGGVYELDFFGRGVNVLAGYDPGPAGVPYVVMPGRSKMAFVDHLLPPDVRPADFGGDYQELGDFVRGWFEYKISKTPSGVKAILARQGSVLLGERKCPLAMEKVFGLERDLSELSFAYQLGNRSLAPYRLTFATELSFALPGVVVGKGALIAGKRRYEDFAWERLMLEQVTSIEIEDWLHGVRLTLRTAKPIDAWCHPLGSPSLGYQGTSLVLSLPVELAGNSLWSFVGKVSLRAIRRR